MTGKGQSPPKRDVRVTSVYPSLSDLWSGDHQLVQQYRAFSSFHVSPETVRETPGKHLWLEQRDSLIGRSSFYNLARRSLRRWCRQMKRNRCSSHQPFGLQHLDEDATRRAREAAIARFRAGELGRGHTQQLRPQRPWQWLGQNQDLAQPFVIQRKRDHRSAKLRAPFLIGVLGTY